MAYNYMYYLACPFYKISRRKDQISCEGIIPGTNNAINFHTKEQKEAYMKQYCCGSFRKCRIYKIVEGNYRQEEEKEETDPDPKPDNPCLNCCQGDSAYTCQQKTCERWNRYFCKKWQRTTDLFKEQMEDDHANNR